jgi:starvation-inducible outer membrane lipoprotein
MTNSIRIALIAASALTLGACVTNEPKNGQAPTASRQATSAAESACMTAVNSNYGGKVKTVQVASSEFSQANSVVMVEAIGVRGGSTSERWRCLVSNDGKVQDLSVAR